MLFRIESTFRYLVQKVSENGNGENVRIYVRRTSAVQMSTIQKVYASRK